MTTCPACRSTDLFSFHKEESIPVHSCLLLPSRDDAVDFPRGSLELAFCRGCGFVFNARFDPTVHNYSPQYEETQIFSPRFETFARELAADWVERFDLRDRTVLEIGCGKGEFLAMMCEAGAGRGIGIDPGNIPERVQSPAADRIEWRQEFYSAEHIHLVADAIVCRHTLEHIQPVDEFMRIVRESIGDRLDTPVLFELPDVARVLHEIAFWDVYYEHCSYFSAGSLARLFRHTGFDVLDVRLDYDDQYLLLEARPSADPVGRDLTHLPLADDLADLAAAVDAFGPSYSRTMDELFARHDEWAAAGQRVVVWGAGSKAVAYLTTLGRRSGVDYAVDVNPHKHGMFIAGTGQEIVAPEFLVDHRPDVIVVMNHIYIPEITEQLGTLGVTARVVGV